jgi:anti-sigma B factor antagonist
MSAPGRHQVLYYDGALPVVVAPDEIDITSWTLLEAELLAASRYGATVIVDMTETTFCDSSGIRLFLLAHDRAAADGGELRLAAVGPAVMRILELLGANRVLSIYPTVGEALQQPSAVEPLQLATEAGTD